MANAVEQADLRDFVARATLDGNDRPRLLAEQFAADRRQRAEELQLLRKLARTVAGLPTRGEVAEIVANLVGQPQPEASTDGDAAADTVGRCIYCGEPTRGRVCRAHEDLLCVDGAA